MAKSKKTKIHKKIDGQLLQMNKSFNNLKMKQKDKITAWVYEEYKKYVTENEKLPDSEADEYIIDAVLGKINEAQIWISSGEKIQQVVDWFIADDNHNIVYTFHNEKQNKDVYMVALRDEGKLIGYYEKHEYRNTEKMKLYDLW